MTAKTLIVYSTKTGINAEAAHVIADTLKATANMDVTVADLKDGSPEIAPFQNIIVGGGVRSTSVYDEAVNFLEKDFQGRNVALYFCCEDSENPKLQSTEDNTKKAMAKNKSLKPIAVAAFGGCMIKQGRAVMDELNMDRVEDWAVELARKFSGLNLLKSVPFGFGFQFFTGFDRSTGITASSMAEFAEKLQLVSAKSVMFHFQRQDFQRWFKNTIGDEEVARRIDQINIWIHDENLRKELIEIVQNRITELSKPS